MREFPGLRSVAIDLRAVRALPIELQLKERVAVGHLYPHPHDR